MFRYPLKLDERLSPSEIVVHKRFFSQANISHAALMVRESVDNSYSHGDVYDAMCEVFTRTLGGKNGVGSKDGGIINEMNSDVVAQILKRKLASNQASKVSRRVGFENSKIPAAILPRASFSLESEDEDRGKVSYEFM